MDPLILVLIILLVIGAFGGYRFGGPYLGGGLGLILLLILILVLTGKVQF